MPAKGGNALDDAARRETYLLHRLSGIPPTQSARLAGYKNPRESCRDLEKNPEIADEIASYKAKNRQQAKWTRDKVMERLENAVDMAEMATDPSSMVRGLQEINKMQGYYAPETKELVLADDVSQKLDQISQLSEAELLEKLGKQQAYIDAEFEVVEED